VQTIAVVDDDHDILTSVSIALELEGYKVTSYSEGASALAAFRTSRPDLAILDIKMPRMDGMEVLRRLREFSHLPHGECIMHRRCVSHIKPYNGVANSSPNARNRLEHRRRCRHERSLLIPCEPDHGHRIFHGGEALSPDAKNRIPQAVQFLGSRQGQRNAAKIVSRHRATVSSGDLPVISSKWSERWLAAIYALESTGWTARGHARKSRQTLPSGS
jgi:hypothetical protein